jgi:hypothetical protein
MRIFSQNCHAFRKNKNFDQSAILPLHRQMMSALGVVDRHYGQLHAATHSSSHSVPIDNKADLQQLTFTINVVVQQLGQAIYTALG